VILAWLYNSTGSLPLVIIFHVAFNTYGRYLLSAFVGEHFVTVSWSVAVVYLLAAIAVSLHAGPGHLTTSAGRRPRS
jgi:hypothetical protein